MTAYAFTTRWRVGASIQRVFDQIVDVDAWPEWWRGVIRVDTLAAASGGVGARHRFVFRSRLPYSVTFDILVTEVEQPWLLAGVATGELEGVGRWELAPDGDATLVTYVWNVRTTRWWMNLVGPIARPLFEANHDQMMTWGLDGLGRRLGCSAEAIRTSAND